MTALPPLFVFPDEPFRLDPLRTVVGFHGTLADAAHQIVREQRMEPSTAEYDWFGSGIYFWCDHDYRAWEWARRRARRAAAEDGVPRACAVVRASIRLGTCIDIHSGLFRDLIEAARDEVFRDYEARKLERPINTDRGAHYLDCAVFNVLCERMDREVDTIRCPMSEGPPILPGSPIGVHNHVHLCARTMQPVTSIELVGVEQELGNG